METIKFLEVLSRIKSCLSNNDRYVTKEYVRLEVDNLRGQTEKKCENKLYFGTTYCNYCLNKNCNNNKNNKIV